MRLRIKHALAFVLTAAAGSQAGHLLAYAVHFGSAAGALQSSGQHAYFPLTSQLIGGATGLAALLSVLAIGAARLLGGRQARPRPLLDYLPLLFLLQLAFFAGQETLETAAAGTALPDAVGLLLWGALGQLPTALAGAAALAWLEPRTEAAVETLRRPTARLRPRPLRPPVHAVLAPQELGVPAQHARAALAKRGPPVLLPA